MKRVQIAGTLRCFSLTVSAFTGKYNNNDCVLRLACATDFLGTVLLDVKRTECDSRAEKKICFSTTFDIFKMFGK